MFKKISQNIFINLKKNALVNMKNFKIRFMTKGLTAMMVNKFGVYKTLKQFMQESYLTIKTWDCDYLMIIGKYKNRKRTLPHGCSKY